METLTLPALAEHMGLTITAVNQLLRDGDVVAITGPDGVRRVPAEFIDGASAVKSLPAVIRLLRDARYSDQEIVDWLFAPDPSLPGTPIEALRANRGTEIKRRAQAAG